MSARKETFSILCACAYLTLVLIRREVSTSTSKLFIRHLEYFQISSNVTALAYALFSCVCSISFPEPSLPLSSGTKALAVRKSRTSGRSAQAWSRSKMADQMLCFFGPFDLEILGLTNRRLKGKQYKVLKCVSLDNNDVLAVLETVKSLIYQLLPPVFALISAMTFGGNPPRRSLLCPLL